MGTVFNVVVKNASLTLATLDHIVLSRAWCMPQSLHLPKLPEELDRNVWTFGSGTNFFTIIILY